MRNFHNFSARPITVESLSFAEAGVQVRVSTNCLLTEVPRIPAVLSIRKITPTTHTAQSEQQQQPQQCTATATGHHHNAATATATSSYY